MLFAAAVIAGCIDAIAGGGGLLTLPALLLANIPPIYAVGTNKIQAAFGSMTSSIVMLKKKAVDFKTIKIALFASLLGSIIGSIALLNTDEKILSFLIPILLVIMALYFAFSPQSFFKKRKPKCSHEIFEKTAVPAVGFYDGFFGPGAGTFFCLSANFLRGYDIIKATAIAKPLNFASNIGGLIVFLISGKFLWAAAVIMIVGNIVGAYIGAHLVLNDGAKIIRPLVVVMCLGMVVKYFLG